MIWESTCKMMKFRFKTPHILIFFTLCIIPWMSKAKKQKDLQIMTQYQPEDCYEHADIGDDVAVHYTGTLETGAVFDTSRQPNRGPLPFKLGEGKVIPGWERGIKGMCVGEKRRLIIPSHLAYGAKGFPPAIPPDATLIFETELVSLQKKAYEETIFKVLQFLATPVAVLVGVYYLYDKYKKENASIKNSKKDGRDERRRSKKKH